MTDEQWLFTAPKPGIDPPRLRFLGGPPEPFVSTIPDHRHYVCQRGRWWQRLLRRKCAVCGMMMVNGNTGGPR